QNGLTSWHTAASGDERCPGLGDVVLKYSSFRAYKMLKKLRPGRLHPEEK
ncbi:uncharacterized protein METZ01_LOCUS195995, partial [marine metagenome]